VVAYRVGGEWPAENNYKFPDEISSNFNGHPSKKIIAEITNETHLINLTLHLYSF
jgi:hypothetical protein